MWVAILTGKTKYDHIIMNIRQHNCCMVGEAHGGNKDYLDKCSECHRHSGFVQAGKLSIYNDILMRYNNDIEEKLYVDPLTLDELKSMPGVKAFVKHWNECHVTDTGPELR